MAPTFGLILLFRVLEGTALGDVPALAMAYLNEEVPRELQTNQPGLSLLAQC